MDWLAVEDAEQIVHLVSQAGDPTVDTAVPDRKRMLVEGVAKLVGADIWLWTTAVHSSSAPGDHMATNFIDGGWVSDQEPARLYAVLTDPRLRPFAVRMYELCREHHVTLDGESLTSKEDRPFFDAIWIGAGIAHFIVSFYPLSETAASTIGLYRRVGKPAFSSRERAIAHVIFHQVDWLHHHGTNVPAKDKVLYLSPRERQVLVFLLGGDSLKVVSRKLELSQHTVGDYVKQIYKQFSVNSRGELLAHFIAGGQR
jgi:DNA-binding CsgD family transcriptional regulator